MRMSSPRHHHWFGWQASSEANEEEHPAHDLHLHLHLHVDHGVLRCLALHEQNHSGGLRHPVDTEHTHHNFQVHVIWEGGGEHQHRKQHHDQHPPWQKASGQNPFGEMVGELVPPSVPCFSNVYLNWHQQLIAG
ncbi:hypothetical protein IHE45_05G003200 [Dioscorea alata]|uniref:Uncharacterized protein n=1 Tax=Dioscorea alata TaxID=55571 RepID=A0ACB7VYZ8_DIOAL|nr:hypothetical protein IHE45_05G003200 [Dioscorea alata]